MNEGVALSSISTCSVSVTCGCHMFVAKPLIFVMLASLVGPALGVGVFVVMQGL